MNFIGLLFSCMPLFKGKIRLGKFLIPNKTKERVFRIPLGLKFWVPNLVENVSLELFLNGIYEKEVVDFISSKCPSNGVYIDVGANIGALCLVVAKMRPDVNVYAFEASPRVYRFLQWNQEKNRLANLFIFNLGVHESSGLKLKFYSPDLANGKGSFAPVFTDSAEMVDTVSLDDFFSETSLRPDLIKVDVEGFELMVFRGLGQSLVSNLNPIILFEFVDWAEELAGFSVGAAQRYLLDKGYSLAKFPAGDRINSPLSDGFAMILASR